MNKWQRKPKKKNVKKKTTVSKKLTQEEAIKKKTFKLGSSTEELRAQLNNFAERYITLKLSTPTKATREGLKKKLAKELNLNDTLSLSGLTKDQMKYRVIKMRSLLYSARTSIANK